jgi:hypothetical protein
VTNLVFRLSYKGPGYQRDFATQKGILGLPFERREEYIKRSPAFHVDKLRVPVLVHVATNDTDVDFVENQQIVDALRSRKPDLAETRVYVDPPPGPTSAGHTFSRRVNRTTLEREDSAEQIDSWNRTWVFFEWNLRPHQNQSTATAAPPVVDGWREYPLRDGVIAITPARWRTDKVDVLVLPGRSLEYKLTMKKGATLVYTISYDNLKDPTRMISEFHGHTEQVGGVGDLMFYSKTAGTPQSGTFTAPWDGIHGWYLKNNGSTGVVVNLELAGFYELTAK